MKVLRKFPGFVALTTVLLVVALVSAKAVPQEIDLGPYGIKTSRPICLPPSQPDTSFLLKIRLGCRFTSPPTGRILWLLKGQRR